MKLITINSDSNYFVYATGTTKDNTKEGDTKLNVSADPWIKTEILIRQGIGTYPAEVANWESVKTLAKTFHLTISPNASGEATQEDINAVEAAKKAEVIAAEQAHEAEVKKAKKRVMNELGDKLLEKALEENGK